MLESKRKAIIFLTLALLLAFAAGFFVLQKVKMLNADLGGMTKIYVAARDIPSRTVLTPDQVKTKEIPNRFVKGTDYITKPKDMMGKVLVIPVAKGGMLTTGMTKDAAELANENNRLVAVYGNEKVMFDEQLASLDRVDIVVSQGLDGKPSTTTFMKDVLVRGVSNSKGRTVGALVEVPEKDAPKLIHMENYADSIRILKANVGKGDSSDENVESTVTETTTQQPEKAAPAAAKPDQSKTTTPAKQKPATSQKKPASTKPAAGTGTNKN
ncbi:SAF domain-containing protein [Falsibacillus pallidus]|uniref:SAF domain-containing protein n=1 Tax=Falsibacillus pallidus TaxID=493781 RepID=UPI003D97DC1D